MDRDDNKKRYIKIEGNELPYCICRPSEAPTMLGEFMIGIAISEPIIITEVRMTDAEFDALREWEG